ncbi:MAG: hypothetical protein ACLPXM_05910 [Terriglobales bacterium]
MIEYALFYAAPIGSIGFASTGLARSWRRLRPLRRFMFSVSVAAALIAYAAVHVLGLYLQRAHLGYWPEAEVTLRCGRWMMLVALSGLIAAPFGRGYGRIAAVSANLSVIVIWLFVGAAAT